MAILDHITHLFASLKLPNRVQDAQVQVQWAVSLTIAGGCFHVCTSFLENTRYNMQKSNVLHLYLINEGPDWDRYGRLWLFFVYT